MAITKARLSQGMTYDAYKAQMNRNKERFEQVEAGFSPPADAVAAFKALPEPLDVMVLAEDWCGDVIANVPILGKLAQASGKLNVHCFLRDQNDDLMQQYLNQGKYKSIPVFAFYQGADLKEVGVFTERPDTVTAARAEFRRKLFADNPDWGSPDTPQGELPEAVQNQVQAAMVKYRDEQGAWANGEVVKELVAIAKRAAGS